MGLSQNGYGYDMIRYKPNFITPMPGLITIKIHRYLTKRIKRHLDCKECPSPYEGPVYPQNS